MVEFDKKQFILNMLCDGQFHSGEALGKLLGISRSAVSKHVKQLIELGVCIYSVSGKGYSLLNSLTLLSKNNIESYYANLTTMKTKVIVKHVIASTNDELLQQVRDKRDFNRGDCLVAECQTAGRGRRGRTWVSPFGSHIYFSMLWKLDGIQQAMGLSIAVGVAVKNAIAPMSNNKVQVKWPNDLLVDDKKIAGILVELEGQTDGPCCVVIGVGINVQMPKEQGESIDQPWTDMVAQAESKVDRNELVANLIYQLTTQLNNFEQHGLSDCQDDWNQSDRYYDQPIRLIMGSKTITGVGKGIDMQGGIILLEDGADKAKAYYGGEISLRSQV